MMYNFYSHILCTVVLPEDSQVGQNIKYSKSLEKKILLWLLAYFLHFNDPWCPGQIMQLCNYLNCLLASSFPSQIMFLGISFSNTYYLHSSPNRYVPST